MPVIFHHPPKPRVYQNLSNKKKKNEAQMYTEQKYNIIKNINTTL